jgi:low temperature requirement protein LtrA
MRSSFPSPPVLTEETHRATDFELFFDLVFIFALTRVTLFMAQSPTPITLGRGLLLLLGLWMSWTTYTWLSNHARADVGLIRAGTLVAMAAILVAALVIPDAWRYSGRMVDARLTLVLAYIVLRAVGLALFSHAATGDRRLRTTLRLFATTTTVAWIPLIFGAVFGATAQTFLWATAFVIDFTGGFIASEFSGWRLRSPSHFTERHGMVLIIALGESLLSVGVGVGLAVTHWPVLVAALLGLAISVCLWWLYFVNPAPAAGVALARVPGDRRGHAGSDAYTLTHFMVIAGVVYLALGMEQVVGQMTQNQPGHGVEDRLGWSSTVALYGGVILYLAGRLLFLRLSIRSTPSAQLVAIGVALLLLPAARILPALAALGLLTAFLVALVGYERSSGGQRNPTADKATVA